MINYDDDGILYILISLNNNMRCASHQVLMSIDTEASSNMICSLIHVMGHTHHLSQLNTNTAIIHHIPYWFFFLYNLITANGNSNTAKLKQICHDVAKYWIFNFEIFQCLSLYLANTQHSLLFIYIKVIDTCILAQWPHIINCLIFYKTIVSKAVFCLAI